MPSIVLADLSFHGAVRYNDTLCHTIPRHIYSLFATLLRPACGRTAVGNELIVSDLTHPQPFRDILPRVRGWADSLIALSDSPGCSLAGRARAWLQFS